MSHTLIIGRARKYPAILGVGDSLSGGTQYWNDLRSIRSNYRSAITAVGGAQPASIYANMAALIAGNHDIANYTALICAGTNGLSLSDCQTYVPMMISLLNHSRFLILSAYNQYSEISGSASWIAMKSINDWYDATYPNNRFDDRALGVSQNASPTDTANDVIGLPWRDKNIDPTHLVAFGATARGAAASVALADRDW